MKSSFTVCLMLFICMTSFGQKSIIDKDSLKIKNLIGFSPSKTNMVNGLTIKYWYDLDYSVETNGLELDVNPLNVFFPFLAAVHFSEILKEGPPADYIDNISIVTFDKINGVRLGLASLEPAIVNGLEINMAGSFETLLNGISMTPLVNKHYKVNGIGLGLIGNVDTQVSGIQIGLFNTCRKLRGIQLGLWNKNAKRSLPFINWQFRD